MAPFSTDLPEAIVEAIQEMAASFEASESDILITALVPFFFGMPASDPAREALIIDGVPKPR